MAICLKIVQFAAELLMNAMITKLLHGHMFGHVLTSLAMGVGTS